MKKGYLILIVCLIVVFSCNKDDDDTSSNTTEKILGRFVHQIPDCTIGGDSILNCSEFVEFMNNSEASILVGGSDIVWMTTYAQSGNKIELDKKDGFSAEVSFTIASETSLKRIEDDEIWTKVE